MIIEAGRYAPSGNNNQTCHFMLLPNQRSFVELKNLVQDEFSKMEIVDGMYQPIVNAVNNAKKQVIMHFIMMPHYLLLFKIKKNYGNALADCFVHLKNVMLRQIELETKELFDKSIALVS